MFWPNHKYYRKQFGLGHFIDHVAYDALFDLGDLDYNGIA